MSETQARSNVSLGSQAVDADIAVTSCALFRIDHEAYAGLARSALVLDEAQFVKNHQAKTYQCALGWLLGSNWRSPARRWRTT